MVLRHGGTVLSPENLFTITNTPHRSSLNHSSTRSRLNAAYSTMPPNQLNRLIEIMNSIHAHLTKHKKLRLANKQIILSKLGAMGHNRNEVYSRVRNANENKNITRFNTKNMKLY